MNNIEINDNFKPLIDMWNELQKQLKNDIMYTITKEQLQELAKGNAKVERWFPELFETKLEVGKWYVGLFTDDKKTLWFFNSIDERNNIKGYGFNSYGKWDNDIKDDTHYGSINHSDDWRPATESEVFEALKKEAVKRGFVEGVQFKCPYTGEVETLGNRLDYELTGTEQKKFGMCLRDNTGTVIYYKGIWSEIIKEKTLSKSEAEAKLNELINDGYAYKID